MTLGENYEWIKNLIVMYKIVLKFSNRWQNVGYNWTETANSVLINMTMR